MTSTPTVNVASHEARTKRRSMAWSGEVAYEPESEGFRNRVRKQGDALLVELTCGIVAVLDDDAKNRKLLRERHIAVASREMSKGRKRVYAICNCGKRRLMLARLILGLESSPASIRVDFVDDNSLNLCKSNLVVKDAKTLLRDARRSATPVPGVWRCARLNAWVSSSCNLGLAKRRDRYFFDRNSTTTGALKIATEHAAAAGKFTMVPKPARDPAVKPPHAASIWPSIRNLVD